MNAKALLILIGATLAISCFLTKNAIIATNIGCIMALAAVWEAVTSMEREKERLESSVKTLNNRVLEQSDRASAAETECQQLRADLNDRESINSLWATSPSIPRKSSKSD